MIVVKFEFVCQVARIHSKRDPPASLNGVVDEAGGTLAELLWPAKAAALLLIPDLSPAILEAEAAIVAVGAPALAEVVVVRLKCWWAVLKDPLANNTTSSAYNINYLGWFTYSK